MPNLENVQWLTIAALAELWAPELNVPASVIEQEIRIAYYKKHRGLPLPNQIDAMPNEGDLPSRDETIDRDFIGEFVAKQHWHLPSFWFQDPPRGPSFPGRPSIMSAIVQELEAIAERDALAPTLAAQARDLEQWAATHFRGQQTPTAKTIENGIRKTYRRLMHSH